MRILHLWDLLGHTEPLYALAICPDSKWVCTAGSEGIVAKWNLAKGQHAQAIARTPQGVYALYFLGTALWIGTVDGYVYVIDVAKKQLLKGVHPHQGAIFQFGHHPVRAEGWTLGKDGTFVYWDTDTLTPQKAVRVNHTGLRTFARHPKEDYFICGGSDGKLYRIEHDKVSLVAGADAKSVFTLAHVQSGWLTGGREGVLRLWDEDFNLKKEVPAHASTLNALAVHPTEPIFVTAGKDAMLHLWEYPSLKKIFSLRAHLHSINRVTWTDQQTLISAGDDAAIKVWHVEMDA
ncbi:MAG: WD40 repeat domain-containing protein [Bacteroidia bacterium]